ncbi:hypothetical protein A3H80_03090 [Candidatus Roizmanbacteria bacterium RIFCSPLOWO2_02_FULL_37_19]|uniref:SCP domain-containing protein n=1 Tax=Candidatus Roizmanbacteria bacterium RIFCSPHIGHO2_02_FULL_37_24 TaxID=1802037 RepID=A0A1F7GZ97_9BACT|nr:MAG: hypothetical protein A2862_04045 [Candidatus Roizmanbacteria bacterium RIFCSPHIGHO2_01_FULL_38_41]OGK24389.1 MAG: hypothetical protein A3C24_04495 [Candidatus Roizmanbacteria bacterium RIFCSPHIGHO2_02_FULL_37_24]OGK33982.1 MAG: hypothetical protein A3E10_04015 [Candidatus Roizmanbacteria bacterium RIFCSPHIGHO2_12_FULL_37_23]OGK43318.1 MAG: hypothetical protein A2956_03705 [Candidatus Roizmanbacteria bacterium RIFCSPLOWO2_01_FULL_37_57]OGK54070.1 MAG: hypothetical protein A3H80_03090 [Ca
MIRSIFSVKLLSVVVLTVAILYTTVNIAYNRQTLNKIVSNIQEYRTISQNLMKQPVLTKTPSPTPQEIIIKKILPTLPPYAARKTNTDENIEWGIAKQIEEGTYTIRVAYDENMTTPQEAHEALNKYREVNGRSRLEWNDTLAEYAQSRAVTFQTIENTDKHAGFNKFLENEGGFDKLGFRRVGENSYYGGKLVGVHLIEWVFAQSPGHNANQLDQGWSHVGVGVTNSSANFIFAGEKM